MKAVIIDLQSLELNRLVQEIASCTLILFDYLKITLRQDTRFNKNPLKGKYLLLQSRFALSLCFRGLIFGEAVA